MKSALAPWLIAAAFLMALGPTLNSTRLVEVDELIYARVAQEAAVEGHWMPLSWGGKPWLEKPPLLLWLAAATAKAFHQETASWPYRLWCCLAAALCAAALTRLGQSAGMGMAGAFAGALFCLQGDVIFHARFFSMDLALIACGLWSAVAAAQGRWLSAGLWLALAVWIKSWFVLAFFPALAFALLRQVEEGQRKRALALVLGPPLLSLVAVTALYTYVYGPSFLHFDFMGNLWERFQGLSNQRIEDNSSFYGKWAMRTAASLIPLAVAAPVAVLIRTGPKGPAGFVAEFAAVLALSWLAALCLIKAQVINYLLPLEGAVCLCWGLALEGESPGILAALAALSLIAARRLLPFEALLLLSCAAAAGLFWGRRGGARPLARVRKAAWVLAGLLLVLLGHSAWRYLRHPDDPSRELADLLLAHPARQVGETLWLLGENSQAIAFYSRYNIRQLPAFPYRRPREAVLAHTQDGWEFYPPQK